MATVGLCGWVSWRDAPARRPGVDLRGPRIPGRAFLSGGLVSGEEAAVAGVAILGPIDRATVWACGGILCYDGAGHEGRWTGPFAPMGRRWGESRAGSICL